MSIPKRPEEETTTSAFATGFPFGPSARPRTGFTRAPRGSLKSTVTVSPSRTVRSRDVCAGIEKPGGGAAIIMYRCCFPAGTR